MDRDEAFRGADQRMAALVSDRAGTPLTAGPIAAPQVPAFALPLADTGTRVCRGAILTAPPGVDVFALFGDDWQRTGFQSGSGPSPDGPSLVAMDPTGFVLVLWHRAGQIELYVVSPPVSARPGGRFYGGLALGAVLGFLGPCLSLVVFNQFLDDRLAFLAFVPVVLVLGGLLLMSPRARQFGVGLLIGGASTGIVTAGLCASMLF